MFLMTNDDEHVLIIVHSQCLKYKKDYLSSLWHDWISEPFFQRLSNGVLWFPAMGMYWKWTIDRFHRRLNREFLWFQYSCSIVATNKTCCRSHAVFWIEKGTYWPNMPSLWQTEERLVLSPIEIDYRRSMRRSRWAGWQPLPRNCTWQIDLDETGMKTFVTNSVCSYMWYFLSISTSMAIGGRFNDPSANDVTVLYSEKRHEQMSPLHLSIPTYHWRLKEIDIRDISTSLYPIANGGVQVFDRHSNTKE